VFVALVVQHAMRMRHIVKCGIPAVQNFSTMSQMIRFSKKKERKKERKKEIY
jgi:hypothetical protein